ncbi:hypothetical protein [Nostoc sp. 'Peltigera membranacea cyanobiont' 210A]|nr:hypothetical protein [Nostoc sp. 'Peltigera membranacea cyanobiont' 210A]
MRSPFLSNTASDRLRVMQSQIVSTPGAALVGCTIEFKQKKRLYPSG